MLRHSQCYVLIRLFFSGLFYSRDLHKKEETMVFEAHCMSFPCTELLLFNYAKVNTVFHSMAPLKLSDYNWKSLVNVTGKSVIFI